MAKNSFFLFSSLALFACLLFFRPSSSLAFYDPDDPAPTVPWIDFGDDLSNVTPVPADYQPSLPSVDSTPVVRSLPYVDPSSTPDPFDVNLTPVPAVVPSLGFSNGWFNYYTYHATSKLYTRPPRYSSTSVPPNITYGSGDDIMFPLDAFTTADIIEDNMSYFFFQYHTDCDIPDGVTVDLSMIFRFLRFEAVGVSNAYPTDVGVDYNLVLTYEDGTSFYTTEIFTLEQMYRGSHLSIVGNIKRITSIDVSVTIRNTLPISDALSDYPPPLKPVRAFGYPILLSITAYYDIDYSTVDAVNNQTNTIGGFFSSLLKGIASIFVPDRDLLMFWINDKMDSVSTDGILAVPYQVTIDILTIFTSDYNSIPPPLNIPALSIPINGSEYNVFPAVTYDFSSIPLLLRNSVRTIGNIAITFGVISIIRNFVSKFFIKSYSDDFEDSVD